MKRLLFTLMVLGSLNSYGQIFSQDFESSTTRADYVGSSSGQFDWISSFANSPATIETESSNNFFRYDKKGGSSSVITRRTNLNADLAKDLAVVKFKLRVLPPDEEQLSPTNVIANLYLANNAPVPGAMDNDNVNVVPDADLFSALSLRVQKVDASLYRFFISATSTYFEGWQEITYIANKSGSSIDYKTPLGTTRNLASGRQDVWVGTTAAITNATISANFLQTSFNQFKIRIPADFATCKIDIDDIRIYDNVTVLPVNFTSFTGNRNGSVNQLSWSTGNEKENSYFEVLRAGDDGNFSTISTVNGNGTTQQYSVYSFTDFNPLVGNNYYKIRQVDIDGAATEHPVIVNVFFGKTGNGLYVFKDKATGFITVNIQSNEIQTDYLNITDLNGRLLFQEQIKLQSGQNSIQIPDNLQSGVYVVYITGQNLAAKFIL